MKQTAEIQSQRIHQDIETIAGFSETDPAIGYGRPTFSPSWVRARDYVIEEAERTGCTTRIDAHGNVHIRQRFCAWDTPVWLCGSHLDSVPSGGKFDGVTGVVCALELLRCGLDLELIIFAEEEGTTFGTAMLGSQSWVGSLSIDDLTRSRNSEGISYLEKGAAFGVRAESMATDRVRPECYRGFLEVHPEQGLSLWKQDRAVAVVTRVNGRRHYEVCLSGQANHAGSTRMEDRRDALAGAAEAICEIEKLGALCAERKAYSVMTVGRIDVHPNAVNVIPGKTVFTIDFRAQSTEVLADGEQSLRAILNRIAARRNLELHIENTEHLPPADLSREVVQALHRAAALCDIDLPEIPSGALHDAAILAPYLPTAMLFVASKDGISHHPAEFSRVEDITDAVRILTRIIQNSRP